jgi:hypothetical protein
MSSKTGYRLEIKNGDFVWVKIMEKNNSFNDDSIIRFVLDNFPNEKILCNWCSRMANKGGICRSCIEKLFIEAKTNKKIKDKIYCSGCTNGKLFIYPDGHCASLCKKCYKQY